MAMDAHTILMLQYVLNDHGFPVGEPDGAIGPATKRGLQEFSKAYGTGSEPQNVLEFIVSRNYATRKEIKGEAYLENLKEDVAQNLRDPSSVIIRNVFGVDDAGTEYVCGEVNGKNAYGGYAGYTWFYGMNLMGDFAIIQIDDPNKLLSAELKCMMAFPSSNVDG
jgi:peptidoglycan hydrolase-like protein with peptidoglycan-binding domain